MHELGMSNGHWQIITVSGSADCYMTNPVCPEKIDDETSNNIDKNPGTQAMLQGGFGVMVSLINTTINIPCPCMILLGCLHPLTTDTSNTLYNRTGPRKL